MYWHICICICFRFHSANGALGRKGPITSNRSAECGLAEGPNALLSMQLIKWRCCSATKRADAYALFMCQVCQAFEP